MQVSVTISWPESVQMAALDRRGTSGLDWTQANTSLRLQGMEAIYSGSDQDLGLGQERHETGVSSKR